MKINIRSVFLDRISEFNIRLKLEKGELIKKTRKGRTIEYSFNEESPYYNAIQEMIKISYESLTDDELKDLFRH